MKKQKPKPTKSRPTGPALILFGLVGGKPKAGTFVESDAEAATKAAHSLGLAVLKVSGAQAQDLAAKLSAGKVHANGREIVPFIRRDLFEQLQNLAKAQSIETNEPTASDETKSSLSADSSHAKSTHGHRLPKTWDDIQPGDLVLTQDRDPADGWWEAVVVRKVERPVQPKGRVRWITPAEADRLITASAAHLRPLVIFLLYTGARLSEALYLDWRQVELGRSHVNFIATKNGEARGVPLHPRVIAALASLPHREGEVFRRPDGHAYARKEDGGGQIKTGFNGACRRAGIADFSPHDCRHTWASWHYAANRDLPALMKLGGWKSEKMVLRYAHVNVAHLAQTIDALPWGKPGDSQRTRRKKAKPSTA